MSGGAPMESRSKSTGPKPPSPPPSRGRSKSPISSSEVLSWRSHGRGVFSSGSGSDSSSKGDGDHNKRQRLVAVGLLWVASSATWLVVAYLLEFRGWAVFGELWAASVVFFASSVLVLGIVARATQQRRARCYQQLGESK